MQVIVPALKSVCFWFKDENGLSIGAPQDILRHFCVFNKRNMLDQGAEITLIPAKLDSLDQFEPWFYEKFSRLPYKTVHIGDRNPDFLVNSDNIEEKLKLLAKLLARLKTDKVIIHAHHLRHERKRTKRLIASVLPNVKVYVENNGFDNEWGHSVEALLEIFNECPEYKLCLDIAHVKDFKKYSLWDMVSVKEIKARIMQIHFSYSPRSLGYDPYARCRYHGYGPHHALFSLIGKTPSEKTKRFITQYPIIIEGVIPIEDKDLSFFRKETELLA